MAEQDNTQQPDGFCKGSQASCSVFLPLFLRKEELSNKSQLALLQPLHTLVRPNLHATTPTLMEETRVYQVYRHFGNVSCRGQKIQAKRPWLSEQAIKKHAIEEALFVTSIQWEWLSFLGPALTWRLTQGCTLPHPDAAETGSSTLSMTLQGRGGGC